ncbi:MAG: esterase family protein [Bacteroidia bacterium]|nr:esterase family protein [Bacteroidia bacterium]
MKKQFSLFLLSGIFFQLSKAATVDTVSIYSNAMNKSFKCVIITPDSYEKKESSYPVVFLLHGHSSNYARWVEKAPNIKTYSDQFQMIIVCPDGDYNSWYLDSPVDTSLKFETYVSKEVPAYIDSNYKTIKDRKARAITGLSMGGHGGLFLGFRHADFFGACGSMSGGVDLRPFPKSWQLSEKLGDNKTDSLNWKNYSVNTVIENKPTYPLAVIFDCGTEDFFYQVNNALHEKMLRLKIPHDYIERPGQHDWNYWANAIEYQLLFFKKFFDRK